MHAPNLSASSPRRVHWRRSVPFYGAAVVLLFSVLRLLGGALRWPALAALMPGWPPMKLGTALSLVAAAAALFLAARERGGGRRSLPAGGAMRVAGMVLGSVPFFFGAAILYSYLTAWMHGVPFVPDEDLHGRPSPGTSLVLLSTGMCLLVWRRPRALVFFTFLLGLIFGICWVCVTGLMFGVRETTEHFFFGTMSLPTALSGFALVTGLLFLRPMEGLARLFSSPHHAGRLARWLVPLGALVTIVFGALGLFLQDHLGFSTELGVTIYGTAMLLALLAIALRSLWAVDRVDFERRRLDDARAHALNVRGEALRRLEASEAGRDASERRFRSLFDSTYDFLGLLSPEGVVLEANRTALALIGAQFADIVGKSFPETPWWAHSEEERAKLREGIRRAAAGEFVRFETTHPDAHGAVRYIDFSLKPVFDASGAVTHLVPEGRDVTEHKAAEKKFAWLATFPELNPNPLVEIGLDDHVLHYTNPSMDTFLPDLKARGLEHPFLAGFQEMKNAVLAGAPQVVQREVTVGALTFAQTFTLVEAAHRLRIYAADISQRKRAESALRTSEQRYRSLFENMLDGYCYCRVVRERGRVVDAVFLEVNHAFGTLTGLGDVIGRRYSEVLPGVRENNASIFETYDRVTSTGQPARYESFHLSLGRWFSVAVYSQDHDHFVVVFDDITARKQAAAQIEQAAQRLQLATTASGIGVWDWQMEGNKLAWDERMFAIYGLAPGPLVYDSWAQRVLPEDYPQQQAILQQTIRSGGRSERKFRIRRVKDGAIRIIQAAEMAVVDGTGKTIRLVGVNRDITQQETAAANLAASEELLRLFIKYTPAAIAILDTKMRYMQASDRWLRDYHLEGQEILGRSHYEVFPDIPDRWKEVHQRAMAGSVQSCDEDPFYRADGRTEWLQWEVRPWRKAGGDIGGIIFFTQVITARKQAEASLRESEERFRGAFENAAIGMALVSLRGRWLRVNRSLCAIFGRTEAELLASTFQELTHPDDLEADLDQVRALIRGEIDHYQMEKRFFHQTGRIIWALMAVTVVRDAEGQPIYFVSQIKDITERREATERLRASLEEKEVLLREIHHRVKNNLQVITSLLHLQSGYLQDPKDAEIFKECQARIQAIALVHDRLYRSGNLATINFSEHLRELAGLIARGQETAAGRIRLNFDTVTLEVNLDTAIPLGLITAELITNAYKHAFPNAAEGEIHVRLARLPEDRLSLVVEDTGGGLPPGFEIEKASSLGLRLIRALTRQLRGEFTCTKTELGNRAEVVAPCGGKMLNDG